MLPPLNQQDTVMDLTEARAIELITDLLRGGMPADDIRNRLAEEAVYPEPDKVKAARFWLQHANHLLKEAQAGVKKAERRLNAAIRQAAKPRHI
jgi:hypothetical protein